MNEGGRKGGRKTGRERGRKGRWRGGNGGVVKRRE